MPRGWSRDPIPSGTASSKSSSSRKQKIVYGPRQIIARINQDQVISPQITLWNQQGSQVIQGTLLVIPVGEALLYVRPLYLRASGGRIPELNRVIVAYKDQIVMEPTLDAALARIFGGGAGGRTGRGGLPPRHRRRLAPTPAASSRGQPATTRPMPRWSNSARQHYERAMQAQRDGNWALYGEEIRLLGETLRGMSK